MSLTLERVIELVRGEAGFSFQPEVRYADAVPVRAHYDARRNTIEIIFDSPSIGWTMIEGQVPADIWWDEEHKAGAEPPERFFAHVRDYLLAYPEKRAGVLFMAHTVLAVDAALTARDP